MWAEEALPDASTPLRSSTKANDACLVNLVLALACQYHDTTDRAGESDDGRRSGAIFFNNARTLFRHNVADGSDQNLQAIQIMLLTAQYLNSTGSPLKSWEVTGLAIRISHGLGLHRGATVRAKARADPVEGEMIKRVWHGCLMMER